MKEKTQWIRFVFISGIVALIIGAIDPMEGSIVIVVGGICLALSTFLMQDRYKKIFLAAGVMILVGVSSLWFVSSLGGFDPKKEWWWSLLIMPYPLGWLMNIVTLIIRGINKKKQ
jgi:hypothetical protein